jgi:hypothetical protein
MLIGCSNPADSDNSIPELITEEQILEVVREVARLFYYYRKI